MTSLLSRTTNPDRAAAKLAAKVEKALDVVCDLFHELPEDGDDGDDGADDRADAQDHESVSDMTTSVYM